MARQFSVSPIKSEVRMDERINNTMEAIPQPIMAREPIVLPAENPDEEFVTADISILILFLLFYDFFALAEFADAEFVPEMLLTNGANDVNGNVIGILPKKIINRTNPNNNTCPPIIKIKSDVEVSITHWSILTIFISCNYLRSI